MKRPRHFTAVVLFLLLAASGLSAGSLPLNELSAERYMQHVSFLASPQLKGRGNGTPELERAAEYIASQFRSLGLKGAGDGGSYFQKFQITTGIEYSSRNALRVEGASKQKDRDFVTMPISAFGTYEGPVVFAGYGITSETLQWDDYAGLDVKDKAVVVLRHDPEEGTSTRFAQGNAAPNTFLSKAQNARRHGAKAIVFVTDPNHHANAPDTLVTDGDARDLSIIVMHATRAAVMPLFEKAGKNMADVQKAIQEGKRPQSFELTGSKIRAVAEIRPVRKTVRNVLASVAGSDPRLKNEWIVIGAHYDHLGLGDVANPMNRSDIGQIHHGADDNASGTAGVIELARLLQNNRQSLKRSVLLMAFAGEEMGLFGSSHFVNNPAMPLNSITAMINMDMIGRLLTPQGTPKALTVMGAGTSSEFRPWVEDANKEIGLELAFSSGMRDGSDHISFNAKRVPNLFFFSGLHSEYHRPTDTAEKINAKEAVKILALVAATTDRIANAPAKSLFTEVPAERPSHTADPNAPPVGGSPYGTYFGSVPDFRDDLVGVPFADVRADSPAGKAGLKAGDLLVEFAGEPIKNLYDFTDALASKKPGDVVAVVVKRGTETIKVNVTLDVRR